MNNTIEIENRADKIYNQLRDLRINDLFIYLEDNFIGKEKDKFTTQLMFLVEEIAEQKAHNEFNNLIGE